MDIKNLIGEVIFTSVLTTLRDVIVKAVSGKADLHGADLRWADLCGADLHGADLRWANLHGADLRWADLHGADLHGANLRGADLRWADLRGADLRWADLRWADLRGADLRGVNLRGVKIHSLKVFSGFYRYEVWAVVFEDGTRWVKMGCLFYDLTKWDSIGIRNSNPSEFPNDGSEKCEERVAAFEFAKAAALRMPTPDMLPIAMEVL